MGAGEGSLTFPENCLKVFESYELCRDALSLYFK